MDWSSCVVFCRQIHGFLGPKFHLVGISCVVSVHLSRLQVGPSDHTKMIDNWISSCSCPSSWIAIDGPLSLWIEKILILSGRSLCVSNVPSLHRRPSHLSIAISMSQPWLKLSLWYMLCNGFVWIEDELGFIGIEWMFVDFD